MATSGKHTRLPDASHLQWGAARPTGTRLGYEGVPAGHDIDPALSRQADDGQSRVYRIGSPLTVRVMGNHVVGWAEGLAWPVYGDRWLGSSLVDARVDARHEATLFPRRRAGRADPYSQGASRSTMR